MKKHLAIFTEDRGQLILEGKRTVEVRFSMKKIAPFGQVSSGDLVYIKPSGKEIIGQFKVKKVIFLDSATKEDIATLHNTIVERSVDWEKVSKSKYIALIFIGQVETFITAPIKVPKKDLRGWVVLD